MDALIAIFQDTFVVGLNSVLSIFHTTIGYNVLQVVITLSPILLAIILFQIFWPLWMRYVRAEFFYLQKYSLLEIRLPKETMKSPLAMELFLTSLHQTGGESTWFDKVWLGKTRPWFSLEMVSIEGQVKFFIWMRSSWKTFVSAALYAQFPGIEVTEMADDYTHSVHFDPKKMGAWAGMFSFTKPDPYPIKTYVDYGLDKDPKEEFKVDPLAPLLEFLGTVGANQQLWFQLVVRAHKAESPKPGHWFKKTDSWKDQAEAEINKILVRDPKTKVAGKVGEDGAGQRITISDPEREITAAIGRSITKLPFDVGLRAIYIAEEGFFNGTNIPGLIGCLKQFNSEQLNGFKPNGKKWSAKFDYPWQDFMNMRKNHQAKKAIDSFKRRMHFFEPHKLPYLVLNSEELATIFHFPGQVAQTPTLNRIPSKKAEAPANLPI